MIFRMRGSLILEGPGAGLGRMRGARVEDDMVVGIISMGGEEGIGMMRMMRTKKRSRTPIRRESVSLLSSWTNLPAPLFR